MADYGAVIVSTLSSHLTGRQRATAVLAAVAVVGLAIVAPSTARAEDEAALDTSTTVTVVEGGAAQALAERFAPIVAIQTQQEPCGDGEPYYPADVAVILDQPDVVLLDAAGATLQTAPSAADLGAAPDGSNFDLPGSSIRPGCDFERRFGWRTGAPPVQYARVVRDSDDPTVLIVQYWEYFVYNDWNNLHESDWESALVVFDATTPEEALANGPRMMSLSQHYGNERREWSQVQRRGDRPVIYPAAGSHAFFYEQRTWFGMSGDAGFGCDSTVGPSTELDPTVDMLPAQGTADNGYAWMNFRGRWGERQSVSLNDSEPGPQYTEQWRRPVNYIRNGRDGAVSVPTIEFAGVTSFFCSATENVSGVMNYLLKHPPVFLGVVLALVLGLMALARRTRWRPAPVDPLRRRRHAGQVISSAIRLVRLHPRRYLPAGLLVMAGAVIAVLLQKWIIGHTPLGDVLGDGQLEGPTGMVLALAAGALELFVFVVLALIVAVHVTHHLVEPADGTTIRAAWRGGGVLPMFALACSIAFTGPFAFVLGPWYAAAPGAAVAEGLPAGAALRRSRALGRGQRMRTLLITFTAVAGAVLVAPLVGVLVLLIVGKVFWFANLIAGVLFAFTIPALGTAAYLLWADLAARADGEVATSEADG